MNKKTEKVVFKILEFINRHFPKLLWMDEEKVKELKKTIKFLSILLLLYFILNGILGIYEDYYEAKHEARIEIYENYYKAKQEAREARPLEKVKMYKESEHNSCVGAYGDIDYRYVPKTELANIAFVIVTMKKKEETLKLQYVINKKTLVLNDNPSEIYINGEAKNLLDYRRFCRPTNY